MINIHYNKIRYYNIMISVFIKGLVLSVLCTYVAGFTDLVEGDEGYCR